MSNYLAALKAAAYAAVAALGSAKAVEMLRQIIREIEDDDWDRRSGGR